MLQLFGGPLAGEVCFSFSFFPGRNLSGKEVGKERLVGSHSHGAGGWKSLEESGRVSNAREAAGTETGLGKRPEEIEV